MNVADYAVLAGANAPPFAMPNRPATPVLAGLTALQQKQMHTNYDRNIHIYYCTTLKAGC